MYYVRGEIITSSIASEPVTVFAKQIELQQNHPNPFNPSTAISFQQSAVSHITLKVYDIFGKEVATLINNKQLEAGKHNVEWNAEGFASGMYFYRLIAVNEHNQSIIKPKMILLK